MIQRMQQTKFTDVLFLFRQIFTAWSCWSLSPADLILCTQWSQREVSKSSKQVLSMNDVISLFFFKNCVSINLILCQQIELRIWSLGFRSVYFCRWSACVCSDVYFYFFRDYTNPYLPVAPSAIDGSGQVSLLFFFWILSLYNSSSVCIALFLFLCLFVTV